MAIEAAKQEETYLQAQEAASREAYETAALMFSLLGDYKDSAELSEKYRKLDLEVRYYEIVSRHDLAEKKEDFLAVAESYERMGDYSDCAERAEACRIKADSFDKQDVYDDAMFFMYSKKKSDVSKAKRLFVSIGDYKDAPQKAQECEDRIVNLLDKAENNTIKAVLFTLFGAIFLILLSAILF